MYRMRNAGKLFFALLALAALAFGQGAVGTLNGTVTDQAGAVVPGAAVVATNQATGVEAKTTTTSGGDYTLPYLPAGTYTIRVTAPGFRVASAENTILRVAQTMTIDIKLQVGAVTESVIVSDKPELLESDSAEIGQYITAEEYKAWPILVDDGQRQIQQFIFDSLPGTTGGTFQGSINGGQQYSHEILIDGIPVGRADLSGGNNNEFSPSAEAIGEFKLQTGAIGAQYNGGQTAVANFTIKSGGNALHGSAFYYLGNEAFNSIPIQTKTLGGSNPRNRLNNWGYSAGGPVFIPKVYNGHNKTFFFTNLEKTSVNDLVFSGYTTLPAPDFRTGDFSKLLDPTYTGNAKSGTTVGTDALGRPIIFGQIYDPATTRTLPGGAIVRDPFQGNIIPQTRFDAVAKGILAIGLPTPQFDKMLRNEQRVGTCCPYFHEYIVGTKIDHQVGQNHHISGYYNQSKRDRNNSCSARYLPAPGLPTSCWQEQITPGNMGRVSITSTVTPSLINHFAGGYNRFLNENGAPPGTINQGYASKLGLQNLPGTIFPKITFSGNEYQGGTLAQMGVGGSDYSPNGSYVFLDDVTWIHGKHSVRLGYNYTRYYYNDRALSDAGSFSFTPRSTDLPGNLNSTGHAFASFLLGAANSAGHGIVGYSSGFRQPYHAMYAMDDWKVTPKLTVNVGLRWEVIPPFYEVTNRMSQIDLSVPDPGAGNFPGALVFKSRFNQTFWKEIGPRLGVAYKVNEKMVVRAGYAMTNTPPIANNWGYGGFQFGYNGSVNANAGTSPTGFVDDPALYLSKPYPTPAAPLPNTDPSSANFTGGATTAPNANRPGYVQNYNLTIQYQLPKQTLVEVAYVGNKGTRLWGGTPGTGFSEYDALPSRLLSMGDVLNDPVSLHPQYSPYAGYPTDQTVSQAMRPYPQYYGVAEQFPYNTQSNYNSLQIAVTHHLTKGLGFLAAYTWSKTIGYVDSNGPAAYYTTVQDYFNRGLERSVAAFNLPQSFKLTWVYETPFGKDRRWDLHWANAALGGWQIAAIHNYSSGFPVQVGESGLNVPAGFAPNIRPDVVGGVSQIVGGVPSNVDVQVPTQYLNPAAFTSSPLTANGTPLRVGTAPRFLPTVRGPAQFSEKLRLSKKFYLGGESSRFFELGASMINPLKRTTPYISDTTVGDSTFGTLLLGGGNRVMQLSGRIEF
jgi:Carboxypeptidase regulatory-like domain/TonB dependent receptor